MRNRQFRVNYYIDALETRTNPLFSRIKASLLADGVKRLIRQAADFSNNQVAFRATIREDSRTLAYDSRSGLYSEARATILLEFDAEGRFIKLGEASIDLGSILNSGRNGQLLTYRVEKCYDRNARLTVAVDLSEEEEVVVRELKGHEEHTHSRSHCQLPPARGRMRSNYEPNRCHATEYSNLTDLEMEEEEFSMTSDHRVSRPHSNKRSQMETLGRTEIIRAPSQLKLQQELLECRTQIAESQEQMQQLQEECEELRTGLSDAHSQNYQLLAHCSQLKVDIAALEGSKESQREVQAAEVGRYLKLYQESEMERNRLLLQLEQQSAAKVREPNEEKNKLATANKTIHQLQTHIEQLNTQIEQIKLSNSTQQLAIDEENGKRRTVEAQLKELTATMERQRGKWDSERQQLLAQKDQIGHELQVGRFALRQLEREVSQLRISVDQKTEAISRSESQLKFANQAMRQQRRNYSRRLQQLQMVTEREQQQAEQCLQQLQIKTIHQQSRNHTLQQLKQENVKMKRQLAGSKEKIVELQETVEQMAAEKERLEGKLQVAEGRTVEWARERAQLEKQIQATREQSTYLQSLQSERSVPEIVDRQEIMGQCYEERDLYWREEIEHLERDTKNLMEKARRDREHLTNRTAQLQQQLEEVQQQLTDAQSRAQQLETSQQRWKKMVQQADNKGTSLKKTIGELESELSQRKDTAAALKQQIQLREEAESNFSELQSKQNTLNKQLSAMKESLQEERRKLATLSSETRQICVWVSGWLAKGDKQKLFFEQLRSESIGSESLSLLNTSIKNYCDRHNKLKVKLEELEEVKAELETRERENDRLNKSMRNMRRSQNGSCDSHISESSDSTARLPLPPPSPALKMPLREDHDAATKALLRRQIQELKGKLKKESVRMGELERTIEQQSRLLEQGLEEKNRLLQQTERRSEETRQARQKLRVREKQLQSAKEEGRELSGAVSQLKLELQQANRQLRMEKSQVLKRTTLQTNNRSFQALGSRNDETARMAELERKCRAAQEEADRLRREKEERKGENGMQSKQYKLLESRLREKETALIELRKEAEEERQRSEQQREINSLKLRKLKEEFEEELEAKLKAHRELQTALEESEERVRQITKRSRQLQEQLKQAQISVGSSNERENKSKQLLQTEWELKLKAAASDHQAELQLQRQLLEEVRAQLAAGKEQERRREREIMELKSEVERRERTMGEMNEQLELYGLRVRNFEEEENKYQITIGSLEKKIKVDPVQPPSARTPQRSGEDYEVKSNFSLRTFTFR